MSKILKNTSVLRQVIRTMSANEGGSGKPGAAGGSIRAAGGAFGKMEYAREEEYFRRKQKEQIEGIKTHLHDEIAHHEELIKQHQDQIEKAKAKIHELKDHDHK